MPGSRNEDLKVFISRRESVCGECGENLGSGAWITLAGEKGALCLACADLDHLLFLPPGDAALTRRARKYSRLSAVVLQWSRSRQQYERQGLLVEAEALQKAEEECLADEEVRKRRQEREAIRREAWDQEYASRFTARVRELYPHCPPGREWEIAEHACEKYSDRVGRSAAAKADELAVLLAVAAHLRHRETDYDELLATGHDRDEARAAVQLAVASALEKWRGRGESTGIE